MNQVTDPSNPTMFHYRYFYTGEKECMGISVSGGKGQRKGDVPIFITGIQADGCVARHGQLKVGSYTSLYFLIEPQATVMEYVL